MHAHDTIAAVKIAALALATVLWIASAAAQSLPGVGTPSSPAAPQRTVPGLGNPTPATTPESSGSSGSMLGGGQSPSKVDELNMEMECKNPANAAKPDCVKRMLTK